MNRSEQDLRKLLSEPQYLHEKDSLLSILFWLGVTVMLISFIFIL